MNSEAKCPGRYTVWAGTKFGTNKVTGDQCAVWYKNIGCEYIYEPSWDAKFSTSQLTNELLDPPYVSVMEEATKVTWYSHS